MAGRLTDQDWETLVRRIAAGKCTPFLGAGVNAGILPLARDIADQWAGAQYPFDDRFDLARVAQYLAINSSDGMEPKDRMCRELMAVPAPDFAAPGGPFGVLAHIPVPIFITTNYDDFLRCALTAAGKHPRLELCEWNGYIRRQWRSVLDPANSSDDYQPTADEPLVFHLHGHVCMSESLVLTEDDYLDFLVNVNRDPKLLHPRIQEAIAGSTLLFVGYRLADLNFRVLFRLILGAIESGLHRFHVAVQIPPDSESARSYLDTYFSRNMNVRVYWGSAQEFANELGERWQIFREGNPTTTRQPVSRATAV